MSPWHNVYTVHWQPIPNWAGPLVLAGLVAILPAWVADRIMTSVTLAGFAAAILWLRWRVAGSARAARRRALSADAFHEHGLAVRVYQLHAGGLPVPDHARVLVAGSRSLEPPRLAMLASAADARVLLSPREPGPDGPGLVVLSVARRSAGDGIKPLAGQRLARLARTSASFIPVVVLGLVLSADRDAAGADAPSVEKPVRSLVAPGLGGTARMGRSAVARDQRRAAIHRSRWLGRSSCSRR